MTTAFENALIERLVRQHKQERLALKAAAIADRIVIADDPDPWHLDTSTGRRIQYELARRRP